MISMIANFFVFVLKSFFSMLLWFVKCFFKIMRLFISMLPITAIVFNLFLLLNIFILVGGLPYLPVPTEYQSLFVKDAAILVKILSQAKGFWNANVYVHHGSLKYVPLLVLTLIMIVPVAMILMCASVLMAFGPLLFYTIVADAAIYVLFAVFGRTFTAQFLGRYYKLFPKAGQKHYDRKYQKWLKNNHKAFDGSTDKDTLDDFFEEEFFDDYDEDLYQEYLDNDYDDSYDDGYYNDNYFA